jgi:proteic killer suppression protein
MQRLEELSACENLEIMNYLPQARCQLIQDRKGQLSVDLEHPYRLIFIPEPPFSSLSAGGLDRSSVKKIKIISVEDTHDKKRKK